MQETDLDSLWNSLKGLFLGHFHVETIVVHLISAAGVLLAAWLIILLGKKIIDRLLRVPAGDEEAKFLTDEDMVHTLRVLFKTLLSYTVYIIAAIIMLQIFDFRIITAEDVKSFTGKVIQALFIIFVAKGVLRLCRVFVEHIFRKFEEGKPFGGGEKRAKTLSALLLSVMRYVVYFIAGVMVLQTFGVQTGSIIASAGIAGLAVGFGAQNLVKDVISGFFIIFEDQFSVGEYVSVAGITGTVEELGLRSTTIREWTGHLHTIPNGEITKVKNYERGPILALVTVGITYEADINHAVQTIKGTLEKIYHEQEGSILEVPSVLGVEALSDSSVDLLITAKCTPGKQWAVERELNKRIKEDLDAAGIGMAYPTRVVYHHRTGEGKQDTLEGEDT